MLPCGSPAAIVLLASLSTAQILYKQPGDSCKETDVGWKCEKLGDCPNALRGIKNRKFPQICSFREKEVIVCCEPNSFLKERFGIQSILSRQQHSKSSHKCKEYGQYVKEKVVSPILLLGEPEYEEIDTCAITGEKLIVNGEVASPKEFPHMAMVGVGARESIHWYCGGSLISEKFVLSAAHCSYPADGLKASWIKLGELDQDSEVDDAQPEIYGINKIYQHPDYVKESKFNDIALYELERTVTFSGYVRPACLEESKDIKTQVIASGWGHIEFGGPSSNILQKVSLNISDAEECKNIYQNNLRTDIMLCATNPSNGDTCQGDSGGPLQTLRKDAYCMYSIVGVTSFGHKCGEAPGVYTRIFPYLPWIEGIVWPS